MPFTVGGVSLAGPLLARGRVFGAALAVDVDKVSVAI